MRLQELLSAFTGASAILFLCYSFLFASYHTPSKAKSALPPPKVEEVALSAPEPRYHLRAIYAVDFHGTTYDSAKTCERSIGKEFLENELRDMDQFQKIVCVPVPVE